MTHGYAAFLPAPDIRGVSCPYRGPQGRCLATTFGPPSTWSYLFNEEGVHALSLSLSLSLSLLLLLLSLIHPSIPSFILGLMVVS